MGDDEDDSDFFYHFGIAVLCITSLTTGFLFFLVFLLVTEARKEKQREKKRSEAKRESLMSRRRSSNKTVKNIDTWYDKYPDILQEEGQNNDDIIEEEDINGIEVIQEDIIHTERKNSTPNTAEMILRELFLPPVNEDPEPTVHVSDFKRTSKREKFKATVRRYTVEFQSSKTFEPISSTRKPSAISLDRHRESSASFSNLSSRRKALVFSNKLSYNDDAYSTVV